MAKKAATKAPAKKSAAPKKKSASASSSSGAAPAVGGVKKNRRRRSNNFASYIQRMVAAEVLDNGKKSSMSSGARKSLNQLALNFVRELAANCKKLTLDRNAKTVGLTQVHYGSQLIFDRAGVPKDGSESMSQRAETFYKAATDNFLASKAS